MLLAELRLALSEVFDEAVETTDKFHTGIEKLNNIVDHSEKKEKDHLHDNSQALNNRTRGPNNGPMKRSRESFLE